MVHCNFVGDMTFKHLIILLLNCVFEDMHVLQARTWLVDVIQEGEHIQPFSHSAIQPFSHSAIQPFSHSAIQPFSHSAI
jgi:hypothetical protein